ncbi:MAG: NADH-quinone oxidoreductase subunit C, partial [Myxococcales bacterium]
MTDENNETTPATTSGDAPVRAVGHREGMFGVRGTGDTSGYGGLQRTVSMPAGSRPPYDGWRDDVATALSDATRAAGLDEAVSNVVVHRGEITFHI